MSQIESDIAGAVRDWMFVATISIPTILHPSSPVSSENPLPKSFTRESRIPPNAVIEISGVTIYLKKWPDPSFRPASIDSQDEVAALIFILQTTTVDRAQEKMDPILDSLLDFLSFQLQSAIRIVHLQVVDVTAPISEGVERYYIDYPDPMVYPSAKSLFPDPLSNTATNQYPDLQRYTTSYSARTLSALRWYAKAVASPLVVDRFIFLWIALEVLWPASGVSIRNPYKASCGHDIPECPECGQPTSREVIGDSIKKFLTENLGVKESDANDLWRLRQLLHGSDVLSDSKIEKLSTIGLILREAVNNALKQELGFPPDLPPFVSSDRPPIIMGFSLGGIRKITNVDLMLMQTN